MPYNRKEKLPITIAPKRGGYILDKLLERAGGNEMDDYLGMVTLGCLSELFHAEDEGRIIPKGYHWDLTTGMVVRGKAGKGQNGHQRMPIEPVEEDDEQEDEEGIHSQKVPVAIVPRDEVATVNMEIDDDYFG
jgi:hypothetical protein